MKMTFPDYLAKTKAVANEEGTILDSLHQQHKLHGRLDEMQVRAAERSLQIMVENLIGRCKKVLQYYDSPLIPLSGYDSAEILKNVGFYEDEEFVQIRRFFGFRNAIVHDYMDLDRSIVAKIIEHQDYKQLEDFLIRPFQENGVIRKRIENYVY
jgi:uncharacterized protein YutE (UPF0331/DUF86 family)